MSNLGVTLFLAIVIIFSLANIGISLYQSILKDLPDTLKAPFLAGASILIATVITILGNNLFKMLTDLKLKRDDIRIGAYKRICQLSYKLLKSQSAKTYKELDYFLDDSIFIMPKKIINIFAAVKIKNGKKFIYNKNRLLEIINSCRKEGAGEKL